jgi:hypothetical protein
MRRRSVKRPIVDQITVEPLMDAIASQLCGSSLARRIGRGRTQNASVRGGGALAAIPVAIVALIAASVVEVAYHALNLL